MRGNRGANGRHAAAECNARPDGDSRGRETEMPGPHYAGKECELSCMREQRNKTREGTPASFSCSRDPDWDVVGYRLAYRLAAGERETESNGLRQAQAKVVGCEGTRDS